MVVGTFLTSLASHCLLISLIAFDMRRCFPCLSFQFLYQKAEISITKRDRPVLSSVTCRGGYAPLSLPLFICIWKSLDIISLSSESHFLFYGCTIYLHDLSLAFGIISTRLFDLPGQVFRCTADFSKMLHDSKITQDLLNDYILPIQS